MEFYRQAGRYECRIYPRQPAKVQLENASHWAGRLRNCFYCRSFRDEFDEDLRNFLISAHLPVPEQTGSPCKTIEAARLLPLNVLEGEIYRRVPRKVTGQGKCRFFDPRLS